MLRTTSLVALAALGLSACSQSPDPDETGLDNVDTASEAEAAAEALAAGDFGELQLGPKIAGPQGPEVKTTLSNEAGNFADITSYVACPAPTTEDGQPIPPTFNSVCDPSKMPAGTIYTYVHIVYPGEDNDASTGAGEGATSSDVERATLFRMTRPAIGFNGVAGFSKVEALSAIGEKADVVVTCDGGALAWTVSAGDGGDQWQDREPITFFWQSTVPPAGPAEAYALDADGTRATGNGPYPGNVDGAAQGCSG